MSHLISSRRLALAAHLMVSYLSLTQAGFSLEILDFEEFSPLVMPEYALFRATEDDLVRAIETLDASIGRLQVRRISTLEARTLLTETLETMRATMRQRDLLAR